MNYCHNIDDFKRIPFEKYEQDFTFIVNGKEFQTSRIIADFLSPILRRSHYDDSTLNTFNINDDDIDNAIGNCISKEELQECPLETYFEEFLQLNQFNTIQIDEKHQKYYSIYFYALGNIHEYYRLRSEYFEGITIENVISKIEIITKINNKFYNNNNKEIEGYLKLIEFASEHYEELDKNDMIKLGGESIEEIIKNEHLQLDNEDSLIEFIMKMYESDESQSHLFEYVLFSNVSKEKISEFIKIFNYSNLDKNTWNSICVRLSNTSIEDTNHNDERYKSNKSNKTKKSSKSSKSKKNKQNDTTTKFEFNSNDKFKGILKYLNDKTGGNIVENGTISLTANSFIPSCPVTNMIRFDSTAYFQYRNQMMANILFDFKERTIKIDKYSIHTGTWGTNNGHLKSWILEGSNDQERWDEIDNRSNDSSLNGCEYSSSFDVQQKRDQFYEFIRLRQTGHAWSPESENRFEIRYIEFFGYLNEPENN